MLSRPMCSPWRL